MVECCVRCLHTSANVEFEESKRAFSVENTWLVHDSVLCVSVCFSRVGGLQERSVHVLYVGSLYGALYIYVHIA